MNCPKCGGVHLGGCKRYVESLLVQIESLTNSNRELSNKLESNNSLTLVKKVDERQLVVREMEAIKAQFDKTAYQREYMRKWRANKCQS